MPIPRAAVVRRVRRVGARDLGHLGVGQLPVEIVASLATRRIRPVRNGSYGRLLYPHNDDCSLPDFPLPVQTSSSGSSIRPTMPRRAGAFPERDRTLTEPRTCVKARRLRAVEVTNEDSVAAPAERQPSGGEVPAGLTVEAGNDTSDLVVVTFNERIHRSGLTLDGLRIRSRRVGGSADVRPPHAAADGSAAALNRSSNSASRCCAPSMPFAFTWPKPRIRSGSDAISTASAWLVWSRPSRSDATARS